MTWARWVSAALVAVAVSCSAGDGAAGDGDVAPVETTEAVVTAQQVREQAAEVMGQVDTVAFAIERSGAPVYIDDAEVLTFDAANGRYAAPSSADAVIDVRAGDLRTQVGAVAIGDDTWLTNPVTGRWEPAPEGLAFNPATLFDPEVGWQPLLADGLADAHLVEASPDGEGRYHLKGTVAGDRVSTMTGGLVDDQTELDVWVDAQSFRVVAARFDTPTAGGVATWDLRLADYGTEVTITEPDLGAGS